MEIKLYPTSRLRFVERPVLLREEGPYQVSSMVRILQQWWGPFFNGPEDQGEWRDVPLEQPDSADEGRK